MPPQINRPYCRSTINLENRREIDFEKIMRALDTSPKTFTEFLAITDLPRKTLGLKLRELCTSGSIIKDGKYHLNSPIKPVNKILRKRTRNGNMNGPTSHIGKNVQWIPAVLIFCLILLAFGSAIMLSPPHKLSPPTASFSYAPASNVFIGTILTFDASISRDLDGHIAGYLWNFGDGSTASGVIVTHAYSARGSYSVTLQVMDDQGLKNSQQKILYVYSAPPEQIAIKFTISPDANIEGWENKWIVNRTLTFNASEFNEANGFASSYVWDFGDEAKDKGAIVSHSYSQPGNYTVTLTVTDLEGTDHTLSEQVTIMDMPATKVYIEPLPAQHEIGDIITLNITIKNVTGLWIWQAGMTFNPMVLECIQTATPGNSAINGTTAFTEGAFLKEWGDTMWFPGIVINGVITIHASSLLSPATPASGSGVLATVRFKVIGDGESLNMHLNDVILFDMTDSEIPVYVTP